MGVRDRLMKLIITILCDDEENAIHDIMTICSSLVISSKIYLFLFLLFAIVITKSLLINSLLETKTKARKE